MAKNCCQKVPNLPKKYIDMEAQFLYLFTIILLLQNWTTFFLIFLIWLFFFIGDRGDRGQQQQQRGDQQGGQRSNGNPRGQDSRGPRPDRTPNQPQQQNGQGT